MVDFSQICRTNLPGRPGDGRVSQAGVELGNCLYKNLGWGMCGNGL